MSNGRPGLGFAMLRIGCRIILLTLFAENLIASTSSNSVPPDMAPIPGGVYRPLYRTAADLKELPVHGFYLDVVPVTNEKFLDFVRANPAWRRSQVKRIFADQLYLNNWAGDLDPGTNAALNTPVTYVSWFAAKAYARWQSKRLPTVAEWEYAASASNTRWDGAQDPEFKRQVLRWYSTPAPGKLPAVAQGGPNFWGVYDLHGLVWEWVLDFNTAMVTGDSRADGGLDRGRFCGAGAAGASEVSDFAAFMRYGFRSSLGADYCIHNLGFRCAKDL
jgi:formylglycine-generating enzyme required for sulfatase activity